MVSIRSIIIINNTSRKPGLFMGTFDNRVRESHTTHSATADATVEVKKYLTDAFLPRMEDPLKYWKERAVIFPTLYVLAKKYLCMPATSVPCERIFQRLEKFYVKKEVG